MSVEAARIGNGRRASGHSGGREAEPYDWAVRFETTARERLLAGNFEPLVTVLSLAHVVRDEQIRIISFRKASAQEREVYHEWLATEAE